MLPKEGTFVDIHTHILPGVDDGAPDLAQAVALLKKAWEKGTGGVVLTPHFRGRYRDNVAQKLQPVFEQLKQEAALQCPDMKLYLGSEVGYELDVSEKIADGTVLSLNGTRYVLLEFRDKAFRSRILEGTLEVLNYGYIPILAHVERYEAIRNKPDLAAELIHLGALIQINADSVMGRLGLRVKRCCRHLLRNHCVHFVATDAHDDRHRTPNLKACYGRILRKYGEDRAKALFYQNARVMLTGGEEFEC